MRVWHSNEYPKETKSNMPKTKNDLRGA